MIGILITDMLVPMGESTLREAALGMEASLGSTNKSGASMSRAIKLHSELMAVKTSKPAESLVNNKLCSEMPTYCPVRAHIFTAATAVSPSVSALLTPHGNHSLGSVTRGHCVPVPPAASRLRVSAPLALPMPPVGTGGVVYRGTSAKGGNHSEVPM